ncbi:hypothetical protein SCLCIDRAFT_8856 [Scleroderma citrinum Foug A]|uniref:Uncharacterized protein n=1 Tax=Scleroderma citrinum Foug A TaxID=1036808 RepID=A0A0C3E4M3_9AGAM|nr:hypothetical protein SCLCIDRAFT_8856 [Scleroderma citrinum Foug A]
MSPEAARQKWARIKEDKWQRKEDRIRIQFVRRPQPMTVITPEDIQGDDGQGATESSQRDKTMNEGRIEPSKLLEQKQEEEIRVWQEDKQKIEAKYAVGEWKGKRIIERSWKKIKDGTEQGIWENAMLTVSQVVSAQYDFYVK